MALSVVLGVVILFGGRSLPIGVAGYQQDAELHDELKIFTDVLSLVQRDYVEEVGSKKLVEGAIKGMVAVLDPHSGYLSPDFYSELQVETSGEFGGLGIEITSKDNLLVVVAPIEGSPAERAGILPGDAIVKIDGRFTKDLSLVDAVKRMRGPKGAPIILSIYRQGEQDLIDVEVVRDVIKVKSVRNRYLGEGFGYVRLSQFQERTVDDLTNALQKMKTASGDTPFRGLVLDLRNNPGGLLTQAIRVSDLFLNEGVIVYTDGRVESQKKKFFAHARGTEENYPIVVLVNGGSASASEIVAGALKDHGRALILGSRTFGKGSVQSILSLHNGGALKLTTALYYTKSGRSLQALGVDPDVVMDETNKPAEKKPAVEGGMTLEERMREADLPGAILNPSGVQDQRPAVKKINAPKHVRPVQTENLETMPIENLLKDDPQLKSALDLLKTYNIFGKEAR
jgi:carboxyl-terminal processing protease